MTGIIFTGDDLNIPLTLGTTDSNGNFTALDVTGATIQASLISRTGDILIAKTAVNEITPNSDWANGIIVVTFSTIQTASLTPKLNAFIEVEVDDSGLSTFQTEPDFLIKEAYIT